MFIGLPVNIALFGEESIPFVLLYYLANTSFYWTIGVYEVSRDNPENKVKSPFQLKHVKRIFNPAVIGFLSGIVIVVTGIPIPSFLTNSFRYIGNLTTPLARMEMTGTNMFFAILSSLVRSKVVVILYNM